MTHRAPFTTFVAWDPRDKGILARVVILETVLIVIRSLSTFLILTGLTESLRQKPISKFQRRNIHTVRRCHGMTAWQCLFVLRTTCASHAPQWLIDITISTWKQTLLRRAFPILVASQESATMKRTSDSNYSGVELIYVGCCPTASRPDSSGQKPRLKSQKRGAAHVRWATPLGDGITGGTIILSQYLGDARKL